MSSTKKALFNTSWLLVEKVITLGITFLLSIFLARYLAPEGYGQYSYLAAFIGLLGPFTSLGLNAIVTREIVKGESQHKVLATSIGFRLIGGVIGALIASFVALYCFSTAQDVPIAIEWFIFAGLINIFSAFYVLENYFNALVASKYCVLVRVITLIISTIAKVFGLVEMLPLEFFLWVMVAEIVIRALMFFVTYVYYNKRHYEGRILSFNDIDKDYGFTLLKQSKWLILSGFMSVVYLKIDQMMLGSMSGSVELGIYSVAAKLSEVWYFFPIAVATSFFPKLIKNRENKALYTKQLETLCGALLWIAIVIATIVVLVSDYFVPLLFGVEYVESAAILNVHVWAATFIFMRAVFSKWLLVEGLVKFSLFTHGIAAVINVTMNLILIPIYGGLGAAIATLVSYGVSSYFSLWLHYKTRPMAIIMTKAMIFPVTAGLNMARR